MANNDNRPYVGQLGETIAAKYLEQYNFTIVDRNYRKPHGELDLVASFSNQIHFVEVKTVSYETKQVLKLAISSGEYRPEEQVGRVKLDKLRKMAEVWSSENNYRGPVQLDVIAVRIVLQDKYATVNYFPSVA